MKALSAFLIVSVISLFSLANTPLLFGTAGRVAGQRHTTEATSINLAIDRNPDHYCRRPNASCVQLGCFYDHCDFDSDIEKITRACRGVWDDGCIRAICNQKGDCSFITKFIKYAELCGQGN